MGRLTWWLCRGTIEIKMRKAKTLLLLAVAAVLLLYSMDCFSPGSADAQAMECCATMPCTPANHSHDCCKTMGSAPTPSVLPTARVLLNPPLLAVIEHQPALEIARFVPVIPQPAEAQQHSPPELYTLYASLLI